ncbi:uncharacterized protein LOC106154285 [Lingula anatina]|uniref:Uncharacterized protein LOC106154285 n=1 Tax=Lingula anatina TaxID=7574 RepID=A0A1S3HDD3_LINAN|nr:uncharacterized protein LOC106154285 [Lingula anatina]|eukprot:XP_013384052.1 uncharacterized protein LOC106154285 [Lingula anatina]
MASGMLDGILQYKYKFVGRESELHKVLNEWESRRIIGVYGPPAIGKTEFAERVVQEVGRVRPLEVAKVNLKSVRSVRHIIERFSQATAFLQPFPSEDSNDEASLFKWKYDLAAHIGNRLKECQRYVLEIDNCDHVVVADEKNFNESKSQKGLTADQKGIADAEPSFLWHDRPLQTVLLDLISCLVKYCKNVWILVVSRTDFRFASLSKLYICVQLPRLSTGEGGSLLHEVCPSVKFRNDQLEEIVERCEGVPLHIIAVGDELNQSGDLYSPGELLEALREKRLKCLGGEGLADDERAEKVEARDFARLPQELQNHLYSLASLQNGFTKNEVSAKTGHASPAMGTRAVSAPLRRRNKLEYDSENDKLSIPRLTGEYVGEQITPKLPKSYDENSAKEKDLTESQASVAQDQQQTTTPSSSFRQKDCLGTEDTTAIYTTESTTNAKHEPAPKADSKRPKRNKLTVAEYIKQNIPLVADNAPIKTAQNCTHGGILGYPKITSLLDTQYRGSSQFVSTPRSSDTENRADVPCTKSDVSSVRSPGTAAISGRLNDTHLDKFKGYVGRAEKELNNFPGPPREEWNIWSDTLRQDETGPPSNDDNNEDLNKPNQDGYLLLNVPISVVGKNLE